MLVRGACCGTHCAPAALRSDNRSKSDHKGVCPAAHARPALCASRHGQKGLAGFGPSLRSAPQGAGAARRASRAERSDGPCGLRPSNPFWLRLRRGACGVGMRVEARRLRHLTRRICPNGAPQARSELCGAPRKRPDAGVPLRTAKGSQTAGSPFFWVLFFGEAKKSTSPAGARPGQPPSNTAPKNHQGSSLFTSGSAPPRGPTVPSRALSDCGCPVISAA
jgi:hypothetical protein